MLPLLQRFGSDLLHLFYPHTCAGCGSDLLPLNESICISCYTRLPETGFPAWPRNPVEQLFYGRIPVQEAAALYYFSKHAVLRHLIHALKYKGNQEAGLQLGRWMGQALRTSGRFRDIDCIVPMPLFPERLQRRGYNQAALLCRGMAEQDQLPVVENAVVRRHPTETQTRKSRSERWENVRDSFGCDDAATLANRHVLLVDDVVTTGATLEACGSAVLTVPGCRLSVFTLAWASDD
ncbi:MAG TPA: ComF family protein [Lacibacter sp.]|nr:ComF family protein [Lacibacter sp.]HMO88625.1 ComF family protein [Lacibacter sp.]HMP87330.1 ComF family protein [Lacibacter sp.]